MSKTEKEFSAEQRREALPLVKVTISPGQPWDDVQPSKVPGIELVLKIYLFTLCSVEFKLLIWPLVAMLLSDRWLLASQALEILIILPWTPSSTAQESLKPSSRPLLFFLVLRILLFGLLLSFYHYVPRHSLFPIFQRESFLCRPFAKLFKNLLKIRQFWRVLTSCTAQHSWFIILLILPLPSSPFSYFPCPFPLCLDTATYTQGVSFYC